MGDIGIERREVEFEPVEDPASQPAREAPRPSVPAEPVPERVGR